MKQIFFLLVVVAYFAAGEALKCYQCQSPPTIGCGKDFDKNSVGVKTVESKEEGVSCTKEILTRGNNVTIIRDKGVQINATPEKQRSEALNRTLYICKTDYCNGATSITAAVFSSTALALLLAWKNH